jgi:xanthine dehydrogenase YagR molybdenum-binding subunit
MYALESAMDELAVKVALDPIELRRVNDTMTDPITGKPYSSRSLMQCYESAAKAFGWSKRNPKPGSMRGGDWLIGWGCATARYPTQVAPATARVRLSPDGKATVQVAAHDVGTGTYTVVCQTTAKKLGISTDDVAVVMGDTDLPPAPVSGGSNVTASVSSVLIKACDEIRRKLFSALYANRSMVFSNVMAPLTGALFTACIGSEMGGTTSRRGAHLLCLRGLPSVLRPINYL